MHFCEFKAIFTNLISVNGRKRRSRSISNHFLASTFVLKLLVMVALMSSISNKRPDAVFRSKVVAPDSWNTVLAVRVMRICISTLREHRMFYPRITTYFISEAQIQLKSRRQRSSARICSRMLESSMRSSRIDHLHSGVTELKALVMVVSVDTVIVPLTGQTLMHLAGMAATATLLHP